MGNLKTKKEIKEDYSGCFWGINPVDYLYAGDTFCPFSKYNNNNLLYIHFIMYLGKEKDDIALNLVIPKNFRLTRFLETWMKIFHPKCNYSFSTVFLDTHFIIYIFDVNKNQILFNATGNFLKELIIIKSMNKRVDLIF